MRPERIGRVLYKSKNYNTLKETKMSGKPKQFKIILLLASLLVVGLIVLNGCKKSEPAAPAEPNEAAAATQ
jgi:hypothetical protein